MTMQEAYDTIRDYFASPDCPGFGFKPSGNAGIGGACLYRTEDGGRCAVGVLLPDGFDFSLIEGKGVADNGVWEIVAPVIGADVEDKRFRHFLMEAQNRHDSYASHDASHPLRYIPRLDDLALDFGLDYPTVGDPRFDEVLARLEALESVAVVA